MQFVLTNAGKLLIDSNPGVAPVLQAFKLGSSAGYTPSPTQTDILGSELHTGIPSTPIIQASNLIKYSLFLDFSLGNFGFGEVALYAPGNILFAVGTSTTLIPKIKSAVNVDGNSISLDCYVSTTGTTYSIYAELGNSDININLPSLPSIDTLPPAYLAIPNTYQVSSPGQLCSVLAFSNSSRWSVTGYDTEIHTEIAAVVGTTASSLRFAASLTNPTTVGELLIQGITGLNAGSIRVVSGYSAGINAYSVSTGFIHTPQVGDTFSIVRRNYLTPTAIAFLNGLNTGVGAGQTNGLQSIDLNKIFMTDGTRPAINNFNIANYRLTSVGNPISDGDAINKKWLSDTLDNFNASVVAPLYTAPKVQFGIGAPIGSVPTSPPFYADKTNPGRYDLYINDPSTLAWTPVYPTDAQYGIGAPVTGTTPSLPSLYYDTSVPTRYIPYVFRAGDWHRVGYTDPGINFTGGVTITESLSVGVASPNPLNMTGVGFQTSNTAGINFDMKSVGLNASLRNRWPSTYAFTLNTSNNETGVYELCRNNIAVGGIRILEDGTLQSGTRSSVAFSLIHNSTRLVELNSGVVSVFPTYTANGRLEVNSHRSIISGVSIGSAGIPTNIIVGTTINNVTGVNNLAVGLSALAQTTSGNNNISIGLGSGAAVTTASSNTVVGINAFNAASSGTFNVAVGDGALQSNVSATGRTVVGASANSVSNYTVTLGHRAYSAGVNQISIGLRAGGGTGVNTIAIGVGSMELATTADYSIGIGDSALRNATGSYNLAIGHGALFLNSSGFSNVALGNNALIANTTGSHNLAIGLDTFKSNTIGVNNLGVGFNAGFLNSTGIDNTFIGRSSGAYNTTGSHNTVIGSYAFSTANENVVSTGSQNVAVGARVLSANTTGGVNTAVGYSSMVSNTTGNANCTLGDRSLLLNTAGSRNIALGSSALTNNTTGSNNVAVGTLALSSSVNTSNNTSIGDASLYYNTQASNTVAIGYSSLFSLSGAAIGLVSIGPESCYSMGSGTNTTVIGTSALRLTTSANNAVCIGSYSGEQIPSTIGDVYIGDEAGRAAAGSTGGIATDSVYIGRRAAHSRTGVGSNNVAVGSRTLESANGAYTVALGTNAARAGVHSYNVEIGNSTGAISGNYNTSVLIGHGCTGSATSVGTIVGSTLLGANTFSGSTISNISSSIILGSGLYNSFAGSLNLNRVIVLDGLASSATASNEVTIGNGLYTSYRMYAAGWSNVSDARDKTNIRPLTDGLDLINKLKPVRFEWDTRDGTRNGVEDSGFIAQDLQEALGEANDYLKVVNDSNPEHLMVTKDGLYPVVIKAVQELSAENTQLRAELKRLREDLDSFLNR